MSSVCLIKDNSRPEEPSEDDCCHNGCQSCVFDVYLKALEKWKLFKEYDHTIFNFDLLSQTKFKPFTISALKNLSGDIYFYTFKPLIDDCQSFNGYLPYSAGQYLSLKIDNSLMKSEENNYEIQGSTHLVRDFTIISLSREMSECCFEMVIKLYEKSFTSKYLRSLKLGDLTYWRGPYGDFKHEPNKYSHLIMFCMGTGVAPMFPISKEIVENEMDETILTLHFGCRVSSEIILRDEIYNLSSFWNFTCYYYLSRETDIPLKKYREQIILSRITNKHVEEAISNKSNYFILVCGSKEFNNDIQNVLTNLNIKKNSFYIF